MGSRAMKGTKVKNKKVIVLSVLGVFVAFIAAGVFGVVTLCNSWLEDLPDYQNADAYNTAQPTMVYASDGTTLLAEFQLENRDPVALDQISEYVLKGTVATEDERFYQHNGVDILGIMRAVVVQLPGEMYDETAGAVISRNLHLYALLCLILRYAHRESARSESAAQKKVCCCFKVIIYRKTINNSCNSM